MFDEIKKRKDVIRIDYFDENETKKEKRKSERRKKRKKERREYLFTSKIFFVLNFHPW